MDDDGAEVSTLKQNIAEEIANCTDQDLLDLIYKILIMNA